MHRHRRQLRTVAAEWFRSASERTITRGVCVHALQHLHAHAAAAAKQVPARQHGAPQPDVQPAPAHSPARGLTITCCCTFFHHIEEMTEILDQHTMSWRCRGRYRNSSTTGNALHADRHSAERPAVPLLSIIFELLAGVVPVRQALRLAATLQRGAARDARPSAARRLHSDGHLTRMQEPGMIQPVMFKPLVHPQSTT